MSKKQKFALVVILLIAGFLRLYHLGHADMVTDEALISFRSLGYIDILTTEHQTTPLEWLDEKQADTNRPVWTYLSFHDHPPLTFLVQYTTFKIFGNTTAAARLPMALFGIASVFLIFLITKEVFKNTTLSLISAMIMAINNNSVYISRIAMQESLVIFFILLTFYLFIKALKNDKYFIWWGVALGLGMLTKYTIIFLAPTYIIFLFFYRKNLLINKKFILGAILSIIVFLPVIIYNLMLYKTFGHFDLQLSYILNQEVPQWSNLPGKSTDNLIAKAKNIFPALRAGISPALFSLYIISLFYTIYKYFKTKRKIYLLFILSVVSLNLLYLLIAPQRRFIAMYIPLILLIANVLVVKLLFYIKIKNIYKYGFIIVVVLFATFELFYTINTLFILKPMGKLNYTYSVIREESPFWGYHNLEKFLNEEMESKFPAIQFGLKFDFLQSINNKINKKAHEQNKMPTPSLFIYDFNINWYPEVWYINRRKIYKAEPWLTADALIKILKDNGPNFYYDQGYEKFYFVKAEDTWIRKTKQLTNSANVLEQQLVNQGFEPINIYRPTGKIAFKVYIFE